MWICIRRKQEVRISVEKTEVLLKEYVIYNITFDISELCSSMIARFEKEGTGTWCISEIEVAKKGGVRTVWNSLSGAAIAEDLKNKSCS